MLKKSIAYDIIKYLLLVTPSTLINSKALTCLYIYIYIYIERERERERGRNFFLKKLWKYYYQFIENMSLN